MQATSICDPGTPHCTLRVEPVAIRWDASMPVFAKEEFLRAVGNEYGWLGGIDPAGKLRCVLPFTIVRKAGFRLVRFLVETIPFAEHLELCEEKSFLNGVVAHFRRSGADVIIPATNNAIFHTYPDGADAAPYGTYVVDLRQPEECLWRNLNRTIRLNIGTAQRAGVSIREGMDFADAAYDLISETYARSKIAFMSRNAFKRYACGLGGNGKLLVAELGAVAQSYCLFGFSDHCAYAIYAGNALNQHQGANKLLYWEAIRQFRSLGVQQFDFFGARINPEKGSKQEAINLMKKRFGASLVQGYMWKYSLRPWRSLAYSYGVRYLKGGDIVDHERHKLAGCSPSVQS